MIGRGVIDRVPVVFREQFPGARAVVVADSETMRIVGGAVREVLAAAGLEGAAPFVFTDPALRRARVC